MGVLIISHQLSLLATVISLYFFFLEDSDVFCAGTVSTCPNVAAPPPPLAPPSGAPPRLLALVPTSPSGAPPPSPLARALPPPPSVPRICPAAPGPPPCSDPGPVDVTVKGTLLHSTCKMGFGAKPQRGPGQRKPRPSTGCGQPPPTQGRSVRVTVKNLSLA